MQYMATDVTVCQLAGCISYALYILADGTERSRNVGNFLPNYATYCPRKAKI
jgi:hypothetical protein